MDLNKIDKTKFSKGDHLILEYLLRNKDTLFYETSADIADKIGVSHSTVSRFWPKIGVKNIKDFKTLFLQKQNSTPVSKIKNTLSHLRNSDTLISQILMRNIETLEKTLALTDPQQIDIASNLILNTSKIYVFSPDASLGIAEIMNYRLRRFGIEFIFIEGGSSIFEYLINITKDDLVIIFAYSHVISEISVLLQQKKKAHYATIIFTDLLASGLEEASDAFIYSYRGEPIEYHSMSSPLSVLDCLIISIAQKAEHSMDHINKLNEVRNNYSNLIKR